MTHSRAAGVLLGCLLAFVALFVISVWEAVEHGPYTSWFNHDLRQKSRDARLVGSPISRIEEVLGPPDNIMQNWDVTDANGTPLLDSEYVTTFEYCPYPWLPFSKFQVHSVDGIVRTLEMFDD